jgi:uncharacterized protein YneF (UPF0154 family)
MDKQNGLFRLALVVSVLVGIIFPIFICSKLID